MPGAVKWTEKYRPDSLKRVLGNGKAIEELRSWAASWERGEPVTGAAILYGPAGTGKTSAALALAHELDWDFIEMNASDARTAGMITRIAGPASSSMTFSGRPRLVILDEADNLHGTADRGGAAAMLKLVRDTRQPVLLIANEYYEIEKPLRDAARGIQFRSVRSSTIAQTLREICRAEEVECDADALMMIAERAGGDMRSAVNDLQAAAEGQSSITTADVATSERDVKSSIFKVLEVIFKGPRAIDAYNASFELDESPEDLINWIDENLPLAYRGEELWRGFEMLARADLFLGRVRVRQNYGLWRYAGYLMTAGVLSARAGPRHGYVAFRPPGLWRRMGQTRKARAIRDSAAKKIGARCHVSAAYVRAELMGFVGLLLTDKKRAANLAAELQLDADEIALLMGSSSSTKKVQSIFEQASQIRASELYEEIELGWSAKRERSLSGGPSEDAALQHRPLQEIGAARTGSAWTGAAQNGAIRRGADLVAAARTGGESAIEEKAPAVVSDAPEAPDAKERSVATSKGSDDLSKAQPKKRGRPKKTATEEKAEKRSEKRAEKEPGSDGKRQRSLFDF